VRQAHHIFDRNVLGVCGSFLFFSTGMMWVHGDMHYTFTFDWIDGYKRAWAVPLVVAFSFFVSAVSVLSVVVRIFLQPETAKYASPASRSKDETETQEGEEKEKEKAKEKAEEVAQPAQRHGGIATLEDENLEETLGKGERHAVV